MLRTDSAFSNRYGRQYGLVHQDRIEDLNVVVVGDNAILPYLLLNLAFSGVGTLQGGVYLHSTESRVATRHVRGQFLLKESDVGRDLLEALADRLHTWAPQFDIQRWPENGSRHVIPDVTLVLPLAELHLAPPLELGRCLLFGQLTATGIHVGHSATETASFTYNVLTPSLASLAGAILAQEVLRVTNSIRHFTIADQCVEIMLRLRSKEVANYLAGDPGTTPHGVVVRLRLGGESLPVRFLEPTDRPDEGVFVVSLPPQTLVTRLLLDSLEVVEEPLIKKSGLRPPLDFDVFGSEAGHGEERAVPETIDDISAFLVGVGGLGTWVSGLLAATPSRRCRLTIVDCDDRVEEHNLNRQVLYTDSDIGKPKVLAAQDALLEIRPDAEIRRYPVELKPDFLRYVKAGISFAYEDPFAGSPRSDDGQPALDAVSRLLGMASGDAFESRVFISCLDNMQSRWVLNCVSHLLGRPFVNGGVSAFTGNADFVDPQSGDACLVTRYGESIKRDAGKVQCGGAIPILSIVTTNAVIASLEALYAVCALAKLTPAANRSYFVGTERDLYQDTMKNRGAPDSLGIEEALSEYEGD